MGHRDDYFDGKELPTIDAFMRNINNEVDASWFTSDPDAEQERIHKRFTQQADCMLVNVPTITQFYRETLDRKGMYWTAKAIFDARMVAEFRQIGHSAKKIPDDVDHWDRLVSKHEGLRCRRGYGKPLNVEGFLKKMIHGSIIFDDYPETR